MSKKLVIINGVPGIGKTTVCKELNKELQQSVWLDGDWCWMMNPWTFTEENKRMVEDNISCLLRNFLKNESFEYVVFDWVIPYEKIYDVLLQKIGDLDYKLYKISLVCSEGSLRYRMLKGNREEEQVASSIEKLPTYWKMNTIKIDTTDLSVSQVVDKILQIID